MQASTCPAFSLASLAVPRIPVIDQDCHKSWGRTCSHFQRLRCSNGGLRMLMRHCAHALRGMLTAGRDQADLCGWVSLQMLTSSTNPQSLPAPVGGEWVGRGGGGGGGCPRGHPASCILWERSDDSRPGELCSGPPPDSAAGYGAGLPQPSDSTRMHGHAWLL